MELQQDSRPLSTVLAQSLSHCLSTTVSLSWERLLEAKSSSVRHGSWTCSAESGSTGWSKKKNAIKPTSNGWQRISAPSKVKVWRYGVSFVQEFLSSEYPDWTHYSEPSSSLSSGTCFCQGCHGWYVADSIVRQSQGLKRCFMVLRTGKRREAKNLSYSSKRSVQRKSSASRCAGSWDKCITLGEQKRSDPASLTKKFCNMCGTLKAQNQDCFTSSMLAELEHGCAWKCPSLYIIMYIYHVCSNLVHQKQKPLVPKTLCTRSILHYISRNILHQTVFTLEALSRLVFCTVTF